MTEEKRRNVGQNIKARESDSGYYLGAILALSLCGACSSVLAGNGSQEIRLIDSSSPASNSRSNDESAISAFGYDRIFSYVVSPGAEREVEKTNDALHDIRRHIDPSNINAGSIPQTLSGVEYFTELESAYADAIKYRNQVLEDLELNHEKRLKEIDAEIEAHALVRSDAKEVVENVQAFVSEEQSEVDQKKEEIEGVLADLNRHQASLRDELNEVIMSEELPVRTLEELPPLRFRSQVRDRISRCSFSGRQDLIVTPDKSHVTCLQVTSPTFREVEEGGDLLHEVIRSHALGIFNLQYKVAGLNYQPNYPGRFGQGSLRDELDELTKELEGRLVVAENRYGSVREAKRNIQRSEARLSELDRVKESFVNDRAPKDQYLVAFGVQSDTSNSGSFRGSATDTEVDLAGEEGLEEAFETFRTEALIQVLTETQSDLFLVTTEEFEVPARVGELVVVGIREDAREVRGNPIHSMEIFTRSLAESTRGASAVKVDLGQRPADRSLVRYDLEYEENAVRSNVTRHIFGDLFW